ncbi:MAG: DUF1849 family protein, partial [Kangiella sp.]|nr:DUF1849 family protein [Kangiella sp.]
MRKKHGPVSVLAALSAVVSVTFGDRADAAELASYKAVYDLVPGPSSGQSPYDGVEGLVSRTVERTCDGWIVAEHMAMRVLTRIGGVIDRDIRFTSWESEDGTRYRFAATIKSEAGGEDETLKGSLEVPHAGAGGVAVFSSPEGRRVTLPENTYLPVGQIKRLLAAAEAGEKQVQMHVFDGTEDDGPELMSSVLTGRIAAGEGKGARTEWGPLGMQAGWHVSAAFFDTKTKGAQGTPSFAMTMDLLDNGLPRRLEMDLGGFVVV